MDCEYSDGKAFDLCAKTLTLEAMPSSPADLPVWTYSGADDEDIFLVARKIYKDPFRRGNNIIVLADTYGGPKEGSGESYGEPTKFNTRRACAAAMVEAAKLGDDPWFGIEQEYYLLDLKNSWPLGWPKNDFPGKHGDYYCAVGAAKAVGREAVEAHYRACLYAGVKLGGINSEVAPGQWEYQVGPSSGIDCADDLWMSRYILQRMCELLHIEVTFDPKPVPGWPGIGCHTNYSTRDTRAKSGGIRAMQEQIEKLRLRHEDHIVVYGQGNERRLTGLDNTASMHDFSSSIGGRDTTIRIPAKVGAQGYGYYEDRRPAANMDPYQVCRMIVETTLLCHPQAGQDQEADAAAGVDSR
jgi:glutamine synthetase